MNIKLAGCVIENSEGKILLLHRNTPKRTQWETPGGKIEERELPEQAAIREVQEELGVSVEIIKELGHKSFKEEDFVMSYVWFKARILSGTPKLMEKSFDKLEHFAWDELRKRTDLSENTKNLVNAYYNNKISL